jgi:hypothetical protein
VTLAAVSAATIQSAPTRRRSAARVPDASPPKMLFLSPERTFERKFLQIIITFHLEHHFSKQKVFEAYANQVPLGQRGNLNNNQ